MASKHETKKQPHELSISDAKAFELARKKFETGYKKAKEKLAELNDALNKEMDLAMAGQDREANMNKIAASIEKIHDKVKEEAKNLLDNYRDSIDSDKLKHELEMAIDGGKRAGKKLKTDLERAAVGLGIREMNPPNPADDEVMAKAETHAKKMLKTGKAKKKELPKEDTSLFDKDDGDLPVVVGTELVDTTESMPVGKKNRGDVPSRKETRRDPFEEEPELELDVQVVESAPTKKARKVASTERALSVNEQSFTELGVSAAEADRLAASLLEWERLQTRLNSGKESENNPARKRAEVRAEELAGEMRSRFGKAVLDNPKKYRQLLSAAESRVAYNKTLGEVSTMDDAPEPTKAEAPRSSMARAEWDTARDLNISTDDLHSIRSTFDRVQKGLVAQGEDKLNFNWNDFLSGGKEPTGLKGSLMRGLEKLGILHGKKMRREEMWHQINKAAERVDAGKTKI